MKICTQNAQHAPCRITRLAVFSVHVLFLFGLVAVVKLCVDCVAWKSVVFLHITLDGRRKRIFEVKRKFVF